MPNEISLLAAAKALNKTPKTLLGWIKAGAPCVREGEIGRGHGTLVNLEALQQWRAAHVAPGLRQQTQRQQLQALAISLMRCYRNDQAAQVVGTTEQQAAGLLLLVYERLAKDLTGEPVTVGDLPEEMKLLGFISTDSPPRPRD
jgi:hypothetical protein